MTGSGPATRSRVPPRVAYIMSRFPKITETFVLYEMKELEELGAEVEVFPLMRHPDGPRHPEADAFVHRAHYAPLLSRRLLRANWRMFARDPARYLGTLLTALGGTLGSLRFFLGAVLFWPKCVAFAERAERMGVDHVHAHFANHPALAALIVHRLTDIPYSFTAHGSDLHVDRTMLDTKVRHASFVVTVSAYNRDLIADECHPVPHGKVVVIHCGADARAFGGEVRDDDRDAAGASGDPLRIACVASLEEVKGHRYLLEACRLLLDEGVEVHCDLAGDGPLRDELLGRVKALGLEDRVTVRGAVPRPVVRRILSDADVAVLPSYPTASGKREGIPVALMEAMMSRLPVVASALSGIPELVDSGETGFLVPPGDPWMLAARLQRLAESPGLRRRFGDAGHAKVVAEFDLSAGARRLLAEIVSH